MKNQTHRSSLQSLLLATVKRCLLGTLGTAVAASAASAQPVLIPGPSADDSAGDYERCVSTLLNQKIGNEDASTACARAFNPEDLPRCVERVSRDNGVPIADTLSACRRVRRPVELASCYVDIRRVVENASAADVLGYCRRSLLPERYSNCVLGVNRSAKTAAPQVLQTCIAAGDFYPAELDPTFIPYSTTGDTNAPATPETPNTTPSTTDPTPVLPQSPAPAP